MKKLVLIMLSFILTVSLTAQTKIGQDIDGELAGDLFGTAVAISKDGNVIAVGAEQNSANGSNAGQVKIYRNIDWTWTLMGNAISGEGAENRSGFAVALSDDGTTVAIGAPYNYGKALGSGHVRVYQFENDQWSKVGSDIDGKIQAELSGSSVALSGDGKTVAIGAPAIYSDDPCAARIYKNTNGSWVQVGEDLAGTSQFGTSISLSNDGNIVAVGGTSYGSNPQDAGAVWIYEFVDGAWSRIGNGIFGEDAFDYSGRSVSLSDDGSIVAIGSRNNDDAGVDAGHVRVYKNTNGSWTQLGNDIDGKANYEETGASVSLNSDGTILAIGALEYVFGTRGAGHVRVYEYKNNTWTQRGDDMVGESSGDRAGKVVALSGGGSRVVIGAAGNDGNGSSSGHVRAYRIPGFVGVNTVQKENITPFPNPTNGVVNLQFEDNQARQIRVVNTKGQLIVEENSTASMFKLDISDYPSGNYIIEITANGRITNLPIIKVN